MCSFEKKEKMLGTFTVNFSTPSFKDVFLFENSTKTLIDYFTNFYFQLHHVYTAIQR